MYRHIYVKQILSIKYFTRVSIELFKRFSLPVNDNTMRHSDLYKLIYTSVEKIGVLDPVLCYDVVGVDLDNPPIYRGRKIYGAYLIRGNIRWLVCRDLGIETIDAVVATADHGDVDRRRLFVGTNFIYGTVKILHTNNDINACFKSCNPDARIYTDHIDLTAPSVTSLQEFGVSDTSTVLKGFKCVLPSIDYASLQRQEEI